MSDEISLSTNEPTVDPVSYGEYRNTPTYPGSFEEEKVKDKIGKEPPLGRAELSSSDDVSSDFERMAVAKALGIENIANKGAFQDQTNRIIEWARIEGAKTTSEIVSKIHALQNQVGGRNNLYQLSVYAGLKLQDYYLQKQLKDYK